MKLNQLAIGTTCKCQFQRMLRGFVVVGLCALAANPAKAQFSDVSERISLQAASGTYNNIPDNDNNHLDLTGLGFPASGSASVTGGASSISVQYNFLSAGSSADFQVTEQAAIPSDQYPQHSTNVAVVQSNVTGTFTLQSTINYTYSASYTVTDRFETQPYLYITNSQSGINSGYFYDSVSSGAPDATETLSGSGTLTPGTYTYQMFFELENGSPPQGQPQAVNPSSGTVSFDFLLGSPADFATPEPGPIAFLIGLAFSGGIFACRQKIKPRRRDDCASVK